ncbi:hypothetical protein AAAC51_10390 [Priestia megaterium]
MSKQEKKDQYDAAIRRTIEETFVKLSGHSTDSTGIVMSSFQNEDIADLVQLSFEYGIERVKSALYSLIEQAFFSHDAQVVENYGGKIRTLIRKELSKIFKIKSLPNLQLHKGLLWHAFFYFLSLLFSF